MDAELKTENLRIGGMTCMHCQNIIEKNLKNTTGVQSVTVSYKKGTASVTYNIDAVSIENIHSVIKETGYSVLPANGENSSNIHRAAGFLISIAALYMILDHFGILNFLVPSQLADSKIGYGMLFVIGLITSVHCIAMCGGINLSQCIVQGSAQCENQSRISTFVPAFMYNAGRVVSYTAIGFVLGFIGMLFGGDGSNAGLSVTAQGTLKLIAGAFMVVMGINMLGIFPWTRKLIPTMPKAFAGKVNIGKWTPVGLRPLIVGLLNGFMPCGPLQSMQIVALVSGNPFAGAFSMLLFSLGTVPLMLGLGSIVSALGRKFTANVMNVGATLVVVLGLAMLSQGTALSGVMPSDMLASVIIALCVIGIVSSVPFKKQSFRIASVSVAFIATLTVLITLNQVNADTKQVSPNNLSATKTKKENVNTPSNVQIINSTLLPNRYPNITVQVATPVKWIIDAPQGSINGCNNRINIHEYGITNYTFKFGENIIEFTPTKTGRFQYSCWMGMIRGSITVVESEAEAKNQNAKNFVAINTPVFNKPKPSGIKISSDKLAIAKINGGFQEVTINISDSGISPAVVVMQTGVNAKWIINNTSADINHYTLLFPAYNMQVPLQKGENPLGIRPADSFPFSTANNAHYGYLKTVKDISAIDTNAIKAEAASVETLIYPPETFESGRGGGASCH